MKVFIVLCLAIASTCALNLRGSKFEPDARFYRGLQAEDHQLPYQAALLIRFNPDDTWWCTGALIAKNWVLSTASCVEGGRDAFVYLGEETRELGTKFISKEVIIHPKWMHTSDLENDISLVRISDVTLSNRIKIVPLPAISETYSNYINEPAIVSGWGKKKDHGSGAKLRYAILPIVDNSVCFEYYDPAAITPSTICLSSSDKTSACSVDKSDTLVLEKTGILVGLFSYGKDENCRKGDPVYFTRVTSYRTWINEITGV